jgi:sulfur relay (sulfurtransferase) complex TusBCD TusD component (DsrE family)
MGSYLLIASRDPFSTRDVLTSCYGLAKDLRGNGNDVTVFLVQNGVLPGRASQFSDELVALTSAGITVLADAFSLRERGISADQLVDGVKPAQLDVVIDHLEAGTKCLWH